MGTIYVYSCLLYVVTSATLVVTGASLVVTDALLVVTRSYCMICFFLFLCSLGADLSRVQGQLSQVHPSSPKGTIEDLIMQSQVSPQGTAEEVHAARQGPRSGLMCDQIFFGRVMSGNVFRRACVKEDVLLGEGWCAKTVARVEPSCVRKLSNGSHGRCQNLKKSSCSSFFCRPFVGHSAHHRSVQPLVGDGLYPCAAVPARPPDNAEPSRNSWNVPSALKPGIFGNGPSGRGKACVSLCVPIRHVMTCAYIFQFYYVAHS